MKMACCALLLLICTGVASAAEPAVQAADLISETMRDFERNSALGAALTMRPGTQAELDELRKLAELGPKLAREAVARDPQSADAQYWLGSWLLYGYRVVETEQITFDPEGGGRTETVEQAFPGLSDNPEEGLAALRKATELAPDRGEYLLDYAAAFMDYDRSYEAMGLLKAAWAGQPKLSDENRMHAGFLLSDISAWEGNFAAAREWVYAALSVNPISAMAVERLRALDAAQAAEAAAYALEEPLTGEEWIEPEPEVQGEEEPYWGENEEYQ